MTRLETGTVVQVSGSVVPHIYLTEQDGIAILHKMSTTRTSNVTEEISIIKIPVTAISPLEIIKGKTAICDLSLSIDYKGWKR